MSILTAVSMVASMLLLWSNNKIYSILYLILLYICVSLIFLYLGATVVGLFYFLVYIGAVAVLFLFSVMILNLKDIQLENDVQVLLGIFVLAFALCVQFYFLGGETFEYMFTTNQLLRLVGIVMFKHYSFLLTVAGLILLVSMMGAIWLTNKKKGYYIKNQWHSLARDGKLLMSHSY
jgi:NADH:ubiquinone oxidoreductase subunit 6 (subunit J)